MEKSVAILCVAFLAGLAGPLTAADSQDKKPTTQPAPGPAGPAVAPAKDQGHGSSALAKAAAANKYLFLFFSKTDDSHTLAMRRTFSEAMAKVADKADTAAVKVDDPAEKGIVAKFGVERAPMPLVVAVAPNGAVTKGLPLKFDEKALLDAFASPGMEKSLKALQDRKLVLLCVQNKSCKDAAAAMKGAKDFAGDEKFAVDTGLTTVVIQIDPADAAEARFLFQLNIDRKTDQAVTAFMAPPGVVLTLTKGPTTKEAFMAVLKKALSGGCGPGGCGPGGC